MVQSQLASSPDAGVFLGDEALDGSGSGDGTVWRQRGNGEIDDDEDGHENDDDEASGSGMGPTMIGTVSDAEISKLRATSPRQDSVVLNDLLNETVSIIVVRRRNSFSEW